ncbi:MAG: hypothetical protein KDE53_38220 [Caldilineaceae bacterium]|nr:hypothetical protein [Caldilineaceae bacterium]
MSDLQRYVLKRKAADPDFAEGYDVGYADFKIGVLLRQVREAAGLTQEQVATVSSGTDLEDSADQPLSVIGAAFTWVGHDVYWGAAGAPRGD